MDGRRMFDSFSRMKAGSHRTQAPRERRVLSRDELVKLGSNLLELTSRRSRGVSIEHVARSVTKIAAGAIRQNEDGDWIRIAFSTEFGSGLPLYVRTNQLDDTQLQQIVSQANVSLLQSAARFSDPSGTVNDADQEQFTYNAREFPTVSLWYDGTHEAMGTIQNEALPPLMEQLRTSGVEGAATVGLTARSVLYMYQQGLTSFAEETDSEISVTARVPDEAASGWAGEANRDWRHVRPGIVAAQAIDVARESRGLTTVEPGRRLTILSATAVGQLVREMASAFDWQRANGRGGVGTPLTFPNHEQSGRHTRFGQRVLDPRISMVSDPADPDGGFPPFFEWGGLEWYVPGFPNPATTWIDRGVLTHFAYNVTDGLLRNMTPCDLPRSVRLAAAPGTSTATIAEMLANCADGVYVNRFSNVELIDTHTGMVTGVTCDGCFLVRHGKIEKPIKSFRFVDSPFLAMNRLVMIGASTRVAFGYGVSSRDEPFPRWPSPPVIAPPMMIRDFNFSSLAEAV